MLDFRRHHDDSASLSTYMRLAANYLLRLTVSDGELSGWAEVVVTVEAPQGSMPTVSRESPVDGATVTAPSAVIGSVSEGAWLLEYALGGDEPDANGWVTLSTGEGSLASSALGTLDPTMLLNGAYALRLTATTSSGTASDSIGLLVDRNMKVGNFSVAFTDLAVPVSGLPIEVTRTYDSRDKGAGDFGFGWRLGIRNLRLDTSEGSRAMRSHPEMMFCEETLRRFAEGRRRSVFGKDLRYHAMLDTYVWADEDAEIQCHACMDLLQFLWLRRRTLWGSPPTEYERPEVWASVKKAFPEWPGFKRLSKPAGVDEARDRRAGESLIEEFAEAVSQGGEKEKE